VLRVREAVALALAAVLLSGCASSATTLSTSEGEAKVAEIIETQTGARLKSVRCPDEVEAKKGYAFDCAITGRDSTTGKVRGTVTDVDKRRFHVSAPFMLHVRDAEREIVAVMNRQTETTVEVACPEVITLRKDGTFVCKASAQGETADVTATFTDTTGRFRFKARPTS
jgi:Domain of unknown function (DUF4333)